jgi:hypothetical protein
LLDIQRLPLPFEEDWSAEQLVAATFLYLDDSIHHFDLLIRQSSIYLAISDDAVKSKVTQDVLKVMVERYSEDAFCNKPSPVHLNLLDLEVFGAILNDLHLAEDSVISIEGQTVSDHSHRDIREKIGLYASTMISHLISRYSEEFQLDSFMDANLLSHSSVGSFLKNSQNLDVEHLYSSMFPAATAEILHKQNSYQIMIVKLVDYFEELLVYVSYHVQSKKKHSRTATKVTFADQVSNKP